MATEIERKFLLMDDFSIHHIVSNNRGVNIRQGYLNKDKNRTVRVRTMGDHGYITVKGITVGASRAEYECEIPYIDALEMLQMCDGSIISKTRYGIIHFGTFWEIDIFHGDNTGLIVAEIELTSEDEWFEFPSFVGQEVTHDSKYFNSNLSDFPFTQWT